MSTIQQYSKTVQYNGTVQVRNTLHLYNATIQYNREYKYTTAIHKYNSTGYQTTYYRLYSKEIQYYSILYLIKQQSITQQYSTTQNAVH